MNRKQCIVCWTNTTLSHLLMQRGESFYPFYMLTLRQNLLWYGNIPSVQLLARPSTVYAITQKCLSQSFHCWTQVILAHICKWCWKPAINEWDFSPMVTLNEWYMRYMVQPTAAWLSVHGSYKWFRELYLITTCAINPINGPLTYVLS